MFLLQTHFINYLIQGSLYLINKVQMCLNSSFLYSLLHFLSLTQTHTYQKSFPHHLPIKVLFSHFFLNHSFHFSLDLPLCSPFLSNMAEESKSLQGPLIKERAWQECRCSCKALVATPGSWKHTQRPRNAVVATLNNHVVTSISFSSEPADLEDASPTPGLLRASVVRTSVELLLDATGLNVGEIKQH